MKYLIILVLAALITYLSIAPTKVEPIAWESHSAKELPVEKQNLFQGTGVIKLNQGQGPEDVAIDSAGFIYAGVKDGYILRISPDGKQQNIFANTNGRPLGLHFDNKDNLIVADASKGLLSINTSGEITPLSIRADGIKYKFTDDVDIASDGKIYFTDASHKFGPENTTLEFLESDHNGRFMVYDPATEETKVLLDHLFFANGVAVAKDQSFVLVVESTRNRILKYWLSGINMGKSEVFIDSLPAIPDGISTASDGTFWVGMVSKRSAVLDIFSSMPAIRKAISRIPPMLLPKPKPAATAMQLSSDGKILRYLEDPEGINTRNVSSVQEANGFLFFGSYSSNTITKLKLPLK
jgi:sugar lactone lactonase YvrE